MARSAKIIVDPSSRILYASFYIDGLNTIFGEKNVSFSNSYFKTLKRHSDPFAFEHYFAFVIIEQKMPAVKVVVDFCDVIDINSTAYEWCDKYAKINFQLASTDGMPEKLVLIPPSFGIKIWSFRKSLYYGLSNLIKCNFTPIVSYKRFLHDYYMQYRRPKLTAFCPNNAIGSTYNRKPFVFLIGTLWGENGEKTNQQRKDFIEMVIAKQLPFEGGFLASGNHPKADQYEKYLFHTAYTSAQYLEKTKESAFVFNTPAVHGCLGWKLAEFLAMGKAIISMPIGNTLAPPLEHGVHIHFTADKEELRDAINLVVNDEEYRRFLSQNANEYYNAFVDPKVVIQTILKHLPTRNALF